MGVVKCPDCEGKVSDKIKACPHCGCPMGAQAKEEDKKSAPKSGSGGWWMIILLICGVTGYLGYRQSVMMEEKYLAYELPADFSYTVLEKIEPDDAPVFLEVELNRKATEDELKALAYRFRQEDAENCKRAYYFVPDYGSQEEPWATTGFDSGFAVVEIPEKDRREDAGEPTDNDQTVTINGETQ